MKENEPPIVMRHEEEAVEFCQRPRPKNLRGGKKRNIVKEDKRETASTSVAPTSSPPPFALPDNIGYGFRQNAQRRVDTEAHEALFRSDRPHLLPRRGRHLVAVRAFRAGETILEQTPYRAVLNDAAISQRCAYSFEPPPEGCNLLRCSRSKHARYMNQEMQKKAWRDGYKEECAALVACAPR